jgi:hypothetical protein
MKFKMTSSLTPGAFCCRCREFDVRFYRGSPARTASATVSIDIVNVNDYPPQFTQDYFTFTVSEAASRGSSLFTMLAQDKDEDALLSYSILWNQSTGYTNNENVSLARLQVMYGSVLPKGFPTLPLSHLINPPCNNCLRLSKLVKRTHPLDGRMLEVLGLIVWPGCRCPIVEGEWIMVSLLHPTWFFLMHVGFWVYTDCIIFCSVC